MCNLLADGFFKLSYDDVSVPRSMVKPGETEVPYDTAEAILVPGSPGTIFVALRPDNTTVDPVLLARALIEEADHVGAEGWTKTAHTQRIIPVESIAPEMDYLQLAKQIVSQRFPEIQPQLEPKKSFAVRYEEHSPALHLNSAEVQKAVADLVPDSYTVNLENPDLTILMVVAGGSVVVEGYEKLHRFHPLCVVRCLRTSVEVRSPASTPAPRMPLPRYPRGTTPDGVRYDTTDERVIRTVDLSASL